MGELITAVAVVGFYVTLATFAFVITEAVFVGERWVRRRFDKRDR